MTYNVVRKGNPEEAVDLTPYFRNRVSTRDPRSYASAAVPMPSTESPFAQYDMVDTTQEVLQPASEQATVNTTRMFSMGCATVQIASGEY